MKYRTVIACALALTTTTANADFTHNGSLMGVELDGDAVRIYYTNPRAGLARLGVRRGTLLFEGRIDKSDPGRPYLEGDARIFKRGCDPTPYFVHGNFRYPYPFRLSGAAPVLSEDGCDIVDNVYEGANANLVFTSTSTGILAPRPADLALPDPVQPESSPANRPGEFCIKNVATGNWLNVRSGPGADYGKVGRLQADECDVAGLKQCIQGWCAILQVSTGTTGWVAQDFLSNTR